MTRQIIPLAAIFYQLIIVGSRAQVSQRYQCKPCDRRYTPEPKQQGYPDEVRQETVRKYIDDQHYRRLARQPGESTCCSTSPASVSEDVNNAE